MHRRVVVTGIGVITSIGVGWREFWEATKKGTTGAAPITDFDVSEFSTCIGCKVRDFMPGDYMPARDAKRMDRFAQLGVAASKLAIEDSGIELENVGERMGVVIGSGLGGMITAARQHRILLERGPKSVSPLWVPMMMLNCAANSVSIVFGLKGPNYAVSTACSSGAHAVGQAMNLIRLGVTDTMLCGGSDTPVDRATFAAFNRLGVMTTRNEAPQTAMRPFTSDRDGFIMGEGAGILILEELESARRRDAHIYSEIVGYGLNSDAHHIAAMPESADTLTRVIQLALRDAKIEYSSVDYINAHGSATEYNDRIETTAIKRVFGDMAYKIPISATKPMTGHMVGGSGAVEAITCVLAIQDGIVPPTINYESPSSECDLDYVPNVAREADVKAAVSNSFGFGGSNAILILRRL